MAIFLGFLLGIMPVLKYGVPLILIPISFFYVFKKPKISLAKPGFMAMQYCFFQIFIIIWHSYSLDGFGGVSDINLLTSYFFLSLLVVPFCFLPIFEFDRIHGGIYLGLLGAVFVLALDYFFNGNLGNYRASGFSSNALVPPFAILAIFGYFFSRRLVEGRSGRIDLLILVFIIVAVSAFGGNRMPLYIAVSMSFIAILYTIFICNSLKTLAILGALSVGVFLSILIDGIDGHVLWLRIQKQADIVLSKVDLLGDVGTIMTETVIQIEDVASSSSYSNKLERPDDVVVGVSSIDFDVNPKGEMTEDSSLQRMVMWTNSILYLKEFNSEWILGVGREKEIEIANEFTNTAYSHVHNQYLSWAIEGGLIGLLSAVLLFGSLLLKVFKSLPVFMFLFPVAASFLTNSLMLSGEASSQIILIIILVQILESRRFTGGSSVSKQL